MYNYDIFYYATFFLEHWMLSLFIMLTKIILLLCSVYKMNYILFTLYPFLTAKNPLDVIK